MNKAIAMLEYEHIASGIKVADIISKSAYIEFITLKTVSPGKFVILFTGGLGAVRAALDQAKWNYPQGLLDSFLLGNPHAQVLPAFSGERQPVEVMALGVFETNTVASVVLGADAAAKACNINILRIQIEQNLCGKSFMVIEGGVAEVTEAINCAIRAVGDERVIDSSVLANPSKTFVDAYINGM